MQDFQSNYKNFQEGYTPIIIDLIDNIYQRSSGAMKPYDRVSGYTLWQIERAVAASQNLNDLKNNLRNMYNNPTEGFLDELFANYNY